VIIQTIIRVVIPIADTSTYEIVITSYIFILIGILAVPLLDSLLLPVDGASQKLVTRVIAQKDRTFVDINGLVSLIQLVAVIVLLYFIHLECIQIVVAMAAMVKVGVFYLSEGTGRVLEGQAPVVFAEPLEVAQVRLDFIAVCRRLVCEGFFRPLAIEGV
jgi:hypothetical protein